MMTPMPRPITRLMLATLASLALAFGHVAVSASPASAVPGSTYGYSTCHAKGHAGKGSLWGYKVTWGSYKCARSMQGGYRLNVYNVTRPIVTGFPGKLYSSYSKCKKAGQGMRGSYHGTPITWKEWGCSRGSTQSMLFVDHIS